ncbi:MAG: hypothetical protein P4L16_04735 [Chlamydiales bacterium]|nr:hypothetical protein [Chlamydiales bacterium]
MQINPNRLHPYHLHQNDALLVQFIFNELFVSHQSALTLKEHFKDIANLPNKECLALQNCLVQLLGNLAFNMPNCSILHQEGSLIKLRNYGHIFSEHFQKHMQEIESFCASIQNGFHEGLMAKELIVISSKKSLIEKDNTKLCIHLETLLNSLLLALSHLISILPHYNQNENLLFFLMRQRKELDLLLFPSTTNDLLLKIYPEGLQKMKAFLEKRYSEKGFHHLIPSIRLLAG